MAAVIACAQFLGVTTSSFSNGTTNSGNTVTAAADWTAPTVGAMTIQKSSGGATGSIKQGATFYLYANAGDTGNPASGVATVTASVSAVATVSSATLASGSWTVGGTTYRYRSAQLTAKSTLATGTYAFTVTATDGAGNGSGAVAGSVAVDNSAFAGGSYSWSDGGTTGRYEPGETVGFYYSKPVDPDSIVSGWDGSATTVSVVVVDANVYSTSSDLLAIADSAATTQLPLGTVYLNADYVPGGKTVKFLSSTMTAVGNVVTVTLGTWDTSGNARTASSFDAPDWVPSSAATDAAGNASSTTLTTSFGPASVVPTNKSSGGTAGQAETGDKVTYTFTKAPDPGTILSGWSGGSTSVTVRLSDKNLVSYSSDTLTVLTGAGDPVKLGSVVLNGDYANGSTSVDFTGSTMTLSGSTVTITLGSPSNSTSARKDTGGHKPTWYGDGDAADVFGAPSFTWPVTPSSNIVEF